MENEIDNIIKEELWRCIGTFGLAVIFSIAVISKKLGASTFTILIIPMLITLTVFSLFVIIRKKSSKGIALISLIVGIILINFGVILSFLYRISLSNFVAILIGILGFIYGLIKLKKQNL